MTKVVLRTSLTVCLFAAPLVFVSSAPASTASFDFDGANPSANSVFGGLIDTFRANGLTDASSVAGGFLPSEGQAGNVFDLQGSDSLFDVTSTLPVAAREIKPEELGAPVSNETSEQDLIRQFGLDKLDGSEPPALALTGFGLLFLGARRRLSVRCAIPLLILLAIPHVLPAASLRAVSVDSTRGGNLYVWATDTNPNGANENVYAGVFNVAVDGGTPFPVFCVDFLTEINLNVDYPVTGLPNSVVNNGGRIAWLLVNFFAGIDTVTEGEAMQLAIWDLVHDNGDGFNSGIIQRAHAPRMTSNAVINQAQAYLNASLNQTHPGGIVYQSLVGPDGMQRVITAIIPDNAEPTPEPATLMTAAFPLLALWCLRRRGRT